MTPPRNTSGHGGRPNSNPTTVATNSDHKPLQIEASMDNITERLDTFTIADTLPRGRVRRSDANKHDIDWRHAKDSSATSAGGVHHPSSTISPARKSTICHVGHSPFTSSRVPTPTSVAPLPASRKRAFSNELRCYRNGDHVSYPRIVIHPKDSIAAAGGNSPERRDVARPTSPTLKKVRVLRDDHLQKNKVKDNALSSTLWHSQFMSSPARDVNKVNTSDISKPMDEWTAREENTQKLLPLVPNDRGLAEQHEKFVEQGEASEIKATPISDVKREGHIVSIDVETMPTVKTKEEQRKIENLQYEMGKCRHYVAIKEHENKDETTGISMFQGISGFTSITSVNNGRVSRQHLGLIPAGAPEGNEGTTMPRANTTTDLTFPRTPATPAHNSKHKSNPSKDMLETIVLTPPRPTTFDDEDQWFRIEDEQEEEDRISNVESMVKPKPQDSEHNGTFRRWYRGFRH